MSDHQVPIFPVVQKRRPKAAYVVRPPMQGSRYKFVEMFARHCDLELVDRIQPGVYDFAIVRGDKSTDYKQAMAAGIPYILIEHDVWSVRAGLESDAGEREMIENACAILFTSAHHRELAGKYEMPPSEYIYLRPLLKDLDFEPLPKLPGQNIVYAGGIKDKTSDPKFGYRRYVTSIFPALIAAGWTVHVYPAWTGTRCTAAYEALGCVIHDPVPQEDLYRELSQYQAGFMGYAKSGPQAYVASCRPNKYWEYMGAGIPMLAYNPGSGAHIFEGKWGYVAATLKDIPEVSRKVLAMGSIPDSIRLSEVIDNDSDGFARLVNLAATVSRLMRPKVVAPPVSTKPLTYPVPLGHPVFAFQGRDWAKGEYIDRETAVAMKEAGHLSDPRIH